MSDACVYCGGIGRVERPSDGALVICPACDHRYRIVAVADLALLLDLAAGGDPLPAERAVIDRLTADLIGEGTAG